jgi:hypothetical protein
MGRTLISNIIRIAFVIILQVLVINRLDLMGGMIFPFIYIHAILMLPLETPRWLSLLIGFSIGLLVDGFMDTPGFHASACLWLAFLMPVIQGFLSPRDGYDFGQKPTVQSMGLRWYLVYAGILTLIHHLWLFNIEFFRLSEIFSTLGRVALSGLATVLLLVLFQFLTYAQRTRS